MTKVLIERQDHFLGSKDIIQYDDQLSRPYNITYVDLTSNSVKLLFYFNETNLDPRRQIQKLEVCFSEKKQISFPYLLLFHRFIMKVFKIISMV